MSIPIRKFFDQWYKDYRHTIIGNKDPTGTLNRFDDSVLKVAMLISVANNLELVITQEALDEAITRCEKLVGNVRRTTMNSGKSQWANEKAMIIHELLARDTHMMSLKQINKKYWMNANANEWEEIMKSLVVAGIVNLENHGNEVIYVMPPSEVELWENHLKGKIK